MDSDQDLKTANDIPQYVIDAIAKMILIHIMAEIEKSK